jgi:hypothetical protein
LHQQALRGDLQGMRAVQPARLRFLLDWNQCVANAHQLIGSTNQAIAMRSQSWSWFGGIVGCLDCARVKANPGTLTPTPVAQQCVGSDEQDGQ